LKIWPLLFIATAAWTASAQTFRVNVDAVRVDVLVMDGRKPATGLTAENFELRDSGVVQQIESVQYEDAPLSIMLALDTSRSVEGDPLRNLKDAASAVVDLLKPADRAALMTFSGAVQLRSPWTADHGQLIAGVAAVDASGSTTLYDATYAALTLRDPEPGRRLVLVFSDGADTSSWLPGQNVIEIARRTDAVVYAVTLGSEPVVDRSQQFPFAGSATRTERPITGYRLDFHSGIQDKVPNVPPALLLQPFLDALADETGGKVVDATRSEQLRDTFVQVINEFRSRYPITYTPRGVAAGGWHPIDVKLKGRKGKVTARRGYLR